MNGKFIVFDGTEGSGKSTQVKMLVDRIKREGGPEILLVRDPGSTRIGEQIRSILLNPDHQEMSMRCEMLLYMSARAQMMSEVIAPALNEGKLVISDRFVSSTLAYQLGGDGLTANEIREVADVAIDGRWPELTILLDMPAELSLARVTRAKDRIEQRPMEYHLKVRENYLAQAKADPKRFKVVDAQRDREIVHDDVFEMVKNVIHAREG